MDSNRDIKTSHYSNQQRTRSIRLVFLIITFALFLYPVSVEGIGVNYSYALFPIVLLFLGVNLKKPPDYMAASAILFTLILFIAFVYQYQFYDLAIRRFVSFLIFMTLFTFALIRIDSQMIAAFKIAVVLMSTYFSIIAITTFLSLSAIEALHYEAKDLVGSQRYGFIYLVGFWLALLYQPPSRIYLLMKYAILILIVGGLLLTFSRSSIVALSGSLAIYFLVTVWQGIMRPKLKHVFNFSSVMIAVGLSIFLLHSYLPLTFQFYSDRLFEDAYSGAMRSNIGDTGTSEGTRVHIIKESIDFVLSNPITGTGYLGVWVLPKAEAGSAHNQLMDVLLRVGLFGFAAYGYLLCRLVKYLARNDKPLFWGMVGILIYGMFHETFKECQGGFVLAFLLGMLAQSWRRTKHEVVPKDVVVTRRNC
jgi:O-antigen ligase